MSKESITRLVSLIASLPGLGPRSARRVLFHLINNRTTTMIPLAQSLSESAQNIVQCAKCRNLDSANPCGICTDAKRGPTICVVETVADLWALERHKVHSGHYFILGGVLSAQKGIDSHKLGLDLLIQRAKELGSGEVIIATNPTVDGQTTAWYIANLLKKNNIKASIPAHGLPLGAELDYMDEGTLAAAFKQRNLA